MTDQPLVSIVVPVYNTEKYLSDCLESLLAQTEKNIEILAVDDGSSDGSPAVLRRYAANCPQIRIFTQKNAGPGAARNTALKNARGKYVMFCDSDDMFKPSMCREMAQIMENENVDFAFCDTEEYKKKVQTSHIRKAGMIDISPNSFPEIAVGIPCFIFRNDILKKYALIFLQPSMEKTLPLPRNIFLFPAVSMLWIKSFMFFVRETIRLCAVWLSAEIIRACSAIWTLWRTCTIFLSTAGWPTYASAVICGLSKG